MIHHIIHWIQNLYKKDIFDIWNKEKKTLNVYEAKQFFVNPKEIRYIKMGINIGYEQNGKKEFRRPVLVLKKVGSLFVILPLTTQLQHCTGKNQDFYHRIESCTTIIPSAVIISQLKVVDKKRFMHHIGEISEEEILLIKEKTKELCL